MCTTVGHEEQYCFVFVVLVVESRFFLHVSYCRTRIVPCCGFHRYWTHLHLPIGTKWHSLPVRKFQLHIFNSLHVNFSENDGTHKMKCYSTSSVIITVIQIWDVCYYGVTSKNPTPCCWISKLESGLFLQYVTYMWNLSAWDRNRMFLLRVF